MSRRLSLTLSTAAATVVAGFLGSSANAATWTNVDATTAANWDQDANWGGNPYPNATGAMADITADLTTVGKTISLNVPITIGALAISDSGATNDRAISLIAGTAGALTFNNGTSNSTISVPTAAMASGNHSITAPTSIGGNGVLDVTTNAVLHVSNLSGSSTSVVNKDGSSVLRLNNSLAGFSGTLNVNAGSLQLYSNNAPSAITVNLNGSTAATGPSFRFRPSGNSNETGTFAGKVIATGNVTLEADHGSIGGDSTIQLSAVDLKMASGQTSATLTVGQTGGGDNLFVINNPKLFGNLTVTGGNNQRGVTLNNVTTDSSATGASLTKTGTHFLRVTGTGTYGGGTTIDGGVLAVESNGALGSGPVSVVSGVLRVGVANFTPTYSSLTMASGTTERWTNSLARLGANNNAEASYTVQSGVNLSLQTNVDIPIASGFTATNPQKTIKLNGGTLEAVLGTKYDSASASSSTPRVIGAGVALELVANSRIGNTATTGGGGLANLTVNGVIRDDSPTSGQARSLTKIGTQTVTLAGANLYTGGTNINGGTIVVSVTGTLGSGDVAITPTSAANSLLTLNNSNAIADTATLYLNDDTTTATTRYGQINLNFDPALTETVKFLIIDGVSMAAGVYTAADAPNFITGTGKINVLGVPEPACLSLVGLVGIAVWKRRRIHG